MRCSLAFLLVGLLLAAPGCGRSVGGSPSRLEQLEQDRARIERYEPPNNGRGFSVEPLDQPNPMPDFLWRGWQQRCEWLTPELLDQVGATGPPSPGIIGCVIPLAGNDAAEIAWLDAYRAEAEATHFIREARVAGLQAREFARERQGQRECTIKVNTRSAVSLQVAVWDPTSTTSGDREARCQAGRRIAELVVRRFVPLTGGTPWPRTPQRPDSALLDGKTACQIVDDTATVAANLGAPDGTPRRGPHGSVCEFASGKSAAAHVLLASGKLDGLPPVVAQSDVSPRGLAGLPARLEDAGHDCGLAVELTPATVMHVRYFYDEPVGGGLACKLAEVMAAVVLVELLNQTVS